MSRENLDDYLHRRSLQPKPVKCKTSSCDGRMLYKDNVWRESTKQWYERFVCWRCNREHVKGDPKDKK